jgi:putative tryptophan/tyrosine transport system substrate-binding protein
MRRREFIAGLAGAAAWPLVARAQQRVPVIGVLYASSEVPWANYMAGFHRGLSEVGFVEGRNVAIEYRWAEGHLDRLPAMAADLVRRKVAVILTGGNVAVVRTVISATQTIPLVFTSGADPVAAGFVPRINRPGGNATGISLFTNDLALKRLELLHELIPSATNIGVLVQNDLVGALNDLVGIQDAARRLGLETIIVRAGSENEIEKAFATVVEQGAAALYVGPDALFNNLRERIAALALRHALPTTMADREGVIAGALMSYGVDIPDGYRQAGIYVGRILRGEKAGELAVMQPTRFQLVVNLKTAKAIGLDIAETFLVRVDEVIE